MTELAFIPTKASNVTQHSHEFGNVAPSRSCEAGKRKNDGWGEGGGEREKAQDQLNSVTRHVQPWQVDPYLLPNDHRSSEIPVLFSFFLSFSLLGRGYLLNGASFRCLTFSFFAVAICHLPYLRHTHVFLFFFNVLLCVWEVGVGMRVCKS